MIEAGNVFNRQEYKDSVKKILEYYKREKMDRIMNFSLLSHFYAYVMEGLFDLGETKLCREAMEKLERVYSNKDAVIPGLKDVPWICSTGLFQLALVWYKLGELERGNRLFYYVLDLQNESGGWYGSYPEKGFFARFHRGRYKPFYFQDAEISWAVKYFLDALSLKEKLEFEKQSSSFLDVIDEDDGRYILVKRLIQEVESKAGGSVSVCDAGCGKGRYLKRLTYDLPDIDYYAFDISEKVMSELENIKEKRVGSLTKILYEGGCFDLVYVCEAFEHAINTRSAFRELLRIVKPGGILVIIDKPMEKLGQLDIYEWEQWISDNDISTFTEECGGTLEIVRSVPYEGRDDGLFRAWIITKT